MKATYIAALQRCELTLGKDMVYDDIAPNLIQDRLVTIDEHQAIVDLPTETVKVKKLMGTLSIKADDVFHKLVKILKKDYNWLAQALLTAAPSEDETDLAMPSTSKANIGPCSQFSKHDKENITETKRKRINTTNGSHVKNKKCCPTNKRISRERSVDGNGTSTSDDKALTNDMIKIVKGNYRVSKSWTCLAHSLGLSSYIHNIRVKVNTFVESEDMCVVYLLQEWLGMNPQSATLLNLLKTLRNDKFNDVADELEEKFISTV